MLPLREVIAAVEEQGRRLRAEFYRAGGPRGRRGSAPVDTEIEEALKRALLALVDGSFVGEETEPVLKAGSAELWMIDPQDGTYEFMGGRRGSAISVALLRGGVPVLGVVHAPDPPDRGPDTIAWAEGQALVRNGKPLKPEMSKNPPFVWATASAALKPIAWSRAVAPARYVAMPSIAYRMARVAAGDGAAAISVHEVSEYDIAAGMALMRGAGGVVLDASGAAISLKGNAENRLSGCFAGDPELARRLARIDWKVLEQEPRHEPRVTLGFPRKEDPRLARAQGALLGQVIGDSLGSRVEFKPGNEIARLFPQGVRELADGGPWHTIAGQPTDDSEMALTLARSLVREKGHVPDRALDAYRAWLTSRPVDVGTTTEKGLLGFQTGNSESNGSLMRASPIGIWAAGDPARAARLARDDSALTHSNEACLESCAAYCAAIAAGVAGASRKEMLQAALGNSKGAAREAVERGAGGKVPEDYFTHMGWVLVALQNAFFQLNNSSSLESGLVDTVSKGGDTDTNAAIAGALLGAHHGRDAVPSRWLLTLLACRPLAEAGALRPRPIEYWPDDILELAEALLQ